MAKRRQLTLTRRIGNSRKIRYAGVEEDLAMSQQGQRRKKKGIPGRKPQDRRMPNTEFLKARITAGGRRQKEIAELIGKQDGAFSRMLSGKQLWTLTDIVDVANALGMSTDELLRETGYTELRVPTIPVAGKVTGDARVSLVTGDGEEITPPGGSARTDKVVAYVGDTLGSPLAPYDRAAFITADEPQTGLPPGAVGKLCIVWVDGHMTPLIGYVGAGTNKAASLALLGGKETVPIKIAHKTAVVQAILFA